MTDQFHHWREALAAKRGVETERGNVRSGYYRLKNEAIAFWRRDGDNKLLCWRSGNFPIPKEPDAIEDLFAYCAPHPISFQDYQFSREHGRWPEQPEEIEALFAEDLPPPAAFDAKLISLRAAADLWLRDIGGEVKTKSDADHAANFAAVFAKEEAKAIALHREAKAPHLEAGRAVDALWKPLIDKAAIGKRWAKALCEPFLKAERVRIEKQREAQPDAMPEKPLAGTSGRAVHLRKREVVTISDMRAFLTHLADMNDHPDDFRQAVLTQAKRMITAGLRPPGVEVQEDEKAA